MRSGELARLTGVSADTLRHYERLGVIALPRRSAAGYRIYSAEVVNEIRSIRRGLKLGFSLSEMARFATIRRNGGAPCRQVRALAASKLADMDDRMAELAAARQELAEILIKWDNRLARTAEGKPAGLMQDFA